MNQFEKFEAASRLSASDVIVTGKNERIIFEEIQNFQNSLDNEHEMILLFSNFGFPVSMAVENIYMISRDLICFWGKIDGRYSKILQNVTQINVLMTASKIEKPRPPPPRVGFSIPQT